MYNDSPVATGRNVHNLMKTLKVFELWRLYCISVLHKKDGEDCDKIKSSNYSPVATKTSGARTPNRIISALAKLK